MVTRDGHETSEVAIGVLGNPDYGGRPTASRTFPSDSLPGFEDARRTHSIELSSSGDPRKMKQPRILHRVAGAVEVVVELHL